jgi:hypothetical protein
MHLRELIEPETAKHRSWVVKITRLRPFAEGLPLACLRCRVRLERPSPLGLVPRCRN